MNPLSRLVKPDPQPALGAPGRIEQLQDKKERSLFWRVTFTFTDPTGASHELWFDEGDEETARRYEKPGAVAMIRYDPDFPEQFRLLD